MAGVEGERPHVERASQQPRQPEQTQPQQGRAEGKKSLQGPTTVDRSEQPNPLAGSTLSRAVERTRDLYEGNGWVFVPLGEGGQGSLGVPTLQGEQQPHGGGVNKPELHPPKELPLPFEPKLADHEQQTGNLDPEMERMLRDYAEAVAEGDPEYEKSLHERYKNDPSFRESFDRFRRGGRGAGTLTRSAPDFSALEKKPKKQE
jgi:hypothetical protein